MYVKLLLENRDFLALHVYTALCYSKLVRPRPAQPTPPPGRQTAPPHLHALNLPPRSAPRSRRPGEPCAEP